MNSMTGYGYKETVVDGTQVSVEIRSVNSRFMDLNVNIPSYLNSLEARIRSLVTESIARGKIDLSIRVRDLNSTATVTADPKAAKMYYDAISQIADAIGLQKENIPLSLVVGQEGVLNVSHDYDAEVYWNKINGILGEVLAQFVSDRKREGENLKADLLAKLDVLDSCAAFFKEWQPKMEEKFRTQIEGRFKELLGDHADENRIMEETAAMLVKYTINEEIIRLASHLKALRKEFLEKIGRAHV